MMHGRIQRACTAIVAILVMGVCLSAAADNRDDSRVISGTVIIDDTEVGFSEQFADPGDNRTQTEFIHGTVIIDGTEVGFAEQGVPVNLSGSCNYDWWYGCSPTSAGMMMGYYDRKFLWGGLTYYNLMPGGAAENNSYGGGGGLDFNGDPNPDLVCNKSIASAGHIADYYVAGYGASGDDLPPFHANDCLADFMGTSQDSGGNSNGGTSFWYRTDGGKTYPSHIVGWGKQGDDGMYGTCDYVNYRGYSTGNPQTDTNFFTQLTDNGHASGFTFNEYKAEIDAGRPVMIHVEGHSMCGYGYDNSNNRVYVYDTWDPNGQNPGYFTWGGAYDGRPLWGVTCATMTGGSPLLVLWNPPDWWGIPSPRSFSLRWDLRIPQWDEKPYFEVVPQSQQSTGGPAEQGSVDYDFIATISEGIAFSEIDGGAWGIEGDGQGSQAEQIIIDIDNCENVDLVKELFLQFRMQKEGDGALDLDLSAPGQVIGGQLNALGTDGDWTVYEATWQIDPQPSWEKIIFDLSVDNGAVWIQNLDVGTICVPEPATFALLLVAGLALSGNTLRRRRRRKT